MSFNGNIILAFSPPNVLLGLKEGSVWEGPGSSPPFFLMNGISFFSRLPGKLGRLAGEPLIESTYCERSSRLRGS